MKIVADAHIPYSKDYLGSHGELLLIHGRAISRADLVDADILLVRSITNVDKKLLENTPVKFVGSVTAGADHLDTKWLDQAGIDWSVALGFNAPPVADYVVSSVAALMQRNLLPTEKKRAAIIGVGNVGELVAKRLALLGFEVILCDPVRAAREPGFISTPLMELTDVDLISLHVPLTRSVENATYHFINKRFLERQKPGAILLNASRGAVINTADLKAYGQHLLWCFDVWEHEPKIEKAILEQAVIATPHIAGYSVQSKMRGIDMIYRILEEKKLLNPIGKMAHELPHQELMYAGTGLHWQEVLLGIFNPLVLTSMMRSTLLSSIDHGHLFDEMRTQFNYRHEFAFTKIPDLNLAAEDRKILESLDIQL